MEAILRTDGKFAFRLELLSYKLRLDRGAALKAAADLQSALPRPA